MEGRSVVNIAIIALLILALAVVGLTRNPSNVTPTPSPTVITATEVPVPTIPTSGPELVRYVIGESLKDPVVQDAATRAEISWDNNGIGLMSLDGQPLNLRYFRTDDSSPSYYFSAGERSGNCLQIAYAHSTVLILKGYENVTYVDGRIEGGGGHAWLEFNIGEVVYVGSSNTLQRADEFYAAHNNWSIYQKILLN